MAARKARKPKHQKSEYPTLPGQLGYLNSYYCPVCGKSLIFFIIGFALALAVLFLWNLQYFRQRRKKRKEELQEHPERKTSATKIIIFSILATYYIAFAVGVWVVVTKDFYQLSVLLTFVGGVTAAAVAFYCWKAKAENLLKIKAAYPELSGTLSDFSSMTQ